MTVNIMQSAAMKKGVRRRSTAVESHVLLFESHLYAGPPNSISTTASASITINMSVLTRERRRCVKIPFVRSARYTRSTPLRIADIPRDALQRVVIAETESSETFGAVRRSSATVSKSVEKPSGRGRPSKRSAVSLGSMIPSVETRSDMNGTAEIITKNEACAA